MDQEMQPRSAKEAMGQYIHPELGKMVYTSGVWVAEHVEVFFYDRRLDVALQGSKEEPSPKALKAYQTIALNWDGVLGLIQETLFSFYESYMEDLDEPTYIDSPDELWDTDEIIKISLVDEDTYSITMCFEWQLDLDDTFITAVVEDGQCIALDID